MIPNKNYNNLKDSYLFFGIAQKTKKYLAEHPDKKLLRLGIGDVSLPLAPAVVKALHEAVDDQATKEKFHGYMPECGAPFLRETIAKYYNGRGVELVSDEVFVSSGASDELGDILDTSFKKAALQYSVTKDRNKYLKILTYISGMRSV